MKKMFSLLAVLALVCMATSAVWAANTLPTPKTAIASFTGGDITFDVTFYHWTGTYEGDTAQDDLTWNNPQGVTIASTTPLWGNADSYALIHSVITTTGKVYIYTKNKTNSNTYKATTGRGADNEKVFNGLIRANSDGGDAQNFAPVIFQSVPLSTAKTSWNSQQPAIGGEGYGRRYLLDYDDFNKQTNIDNEYMVIAKSVGIWEGVAEEGWDNYTTEDHVLFFGAQFTNVLGGDTFGTNTLTFNTIVE